MSSFYYFFQFLLTFTLSSKTLPPCLNCILIEMGEMACYQERCPQCGRIPPGRRIQPPAETRLKKNRLTSKESIVQQGCHSPYRFNLPESLSMESVEVTGFYQPPRSLIGRHPVWETIFMNGHIIWQSILMWNMWPDYQIIWRYIKGSIWTIF